MKNRPLLKKDNHWQRKWMRRKEIEHLLPEKSISNADVTSASTTLLDALVQYALENPAVLTEKLTDVIHQMVDTMDEATNSIKSLSLAMREYRDRV